ncbi:MAG: di-trans,poly-cis-decaprenylcistransferase [Opitutales bacterium]|nr:di-trans,poly-cis-decaprenylcistransferase [Opitutales bacterium]
MKSPPSSASNPLPHHVAIIMDGNGRWAAKRHLPRIEGHRRGVEAVKKTIRAAADLGIRHLTLYAFSVENWKRPADEVEALMKMLEGFLKQQNKILHQKKIRLRAIGRIHELPVKVRDLLEKIIRETAHYSEWNLTVALNYGSRTEIVDAVQKYAREVEEGREKPSALDWDKLSGFLNTSEIPDPDLIIRTSGECRLSNFLLLQAAYAEIHVSPVLWPDFDEKSFGAALADYQARERRFGLTGEQLNQKNTPPPVLSSPC